MALAGCIAVPTVLANHDYIRTVVWGGAIVVSAVGWGAIVARRLYGCEARVGWGLEAALGLSVHLALGGLLAMLSSVSVTTSYAAVAIGVGLFALEAWRRYASEEALRGKELREARGPADLSIAGATVIIVFFVVGLVHYLGSAGGLPANLVDDYHAYFSFPKQLLATGTLIEPFSSRRIDSYGGQSYLQALVLAFSTVYRIGVLDNGICVLVLFGLCVGWVRERPRFPLVVAAPALLCLFTLHYYDLNHNAASEFSGAVFFLATFRVLDRPRHAGESTWANALGLALVGSAACTLRQTNLAAAALIPAAYYGAQMLRGGDARRRWAQEAALAALFSLALLLPWMVLAYRSCGTPLYPLILGNGAKDFVSFPISAAEKAQYFVAACLYPGRLPGLLLAFTAGLLVPSRANLSLRASLAGTALATIMLLNAMASADAVDGTDRYSFPYGLAYILAVSLVVAGAVASPALKSGQRSRIAMALVVAALSVQLVQTRHTLWGVYLGDKYVIDVALLGPPSSPPEPGDSVYADRGEAAYAALQRAVPEHATLLVMLDQPFRLDFKRNRILSWDQPGAVSPPPHLPIGQGPERLAQYLLGQGVRYVAYCDGPWPEFIPDAEERYRRGQGVRYLPYCDGRSFSPTYFHALVNLLKDPAPPLDGKSVAPPMRAIARLYLDIVATLEKLAATRKQLYADNGTHVLDLATPASAPA